MIVKGKEYTRHKKQHNIKSRESIVKNKKLNNREKIKGLPKLFLGKEEEHASH